MRIQKTCSCTRNDEKKLKGIDNLAHLGILFCNDEKKLKVVMKKYYDEDMESKSNDEKKLKEMQKSEHSEQKL